MLVTARDVGGDPLEYEMAAQWDVEDGIRLGSDKRYALTDLPLVNLLDRESIVVVHDADHPHVPETTRHIMEQAGTKAVVIVPLIIRGQYDGFLAAASRQPLEFSEGEINFLRAAAEQLSIVLSGLRSAEETSAALDRIAQLNRRMSGEAWRGYLVARRDMTVESGRLPASDDVSRLSVPIVVRGETLGVMDLEDANGQRQWSDEEWDLLNVVAGEVAQAVENARLIEQTQQRAAREAELNRIAAKIRQAGDIDTILRIAAEELSQSLRASHANARLGGLPDEAGRRDGH